MISEQLFLPFSHTPLILEYLLSLSSFPLSCIIFDIHVFMYIVGVTLILCTCIYTAVETYIQTNCYVEWEGKVLETLHRIEVCMMIFSLPCTPVQSCIKFTINDRKLYAWV